MKPPITPALNEQVSKVADQKYRAAKDFTRKGYNKAYDAAIKEAGYSPSYFKSVMAKIGPGAGCEQDDQYYL